MSSIERFIGLQVKDLIVRHNTNPWRGFAIYRLQGPEDTTGRLVRRFQFMHHVGICCSNKECLYSGNRFIVSGKTERIAGDLWNRTQKWRKKQNHE